METIRSGNHSMESSHISGPGDVFLVGELAGVLSPLDLFDSLEPALQILLDATGADDIELFLAEDTRGDLLLTTCRGQDREALMSRLRFARGIGFPGIVVKQNQPLVTDRLGEDSRYLRAAVKRCGIRSYVCIPLTDFGEGALGSLHLAWRKTNVPLQRVSHLLQQAANPISNAIYAGLAGRRMSVRTALDNAAGIRGQEDWLAALLRVFQQQTGADGGMLFLFDQGMKHVVRTVSTGGIPEAQKGKLDATYHKCVDLCDRHGVALGTGGGYYLDLCKEVVESGHAACCAPLILQNRLVGRVLLDYGKNPGGSLNKDLVSLMAMAGEAAGHIPLPLFQEPGRVGITRPPKIQAGSGKGLELRCLGEFSVIRNGKPVTRSSFFYRSKARTLLKFLLSRDGKPVNKEILIDFLWPDADDFSGTNRLHGVIHALRAAIESDHRKKEWMYIRREGEGYYFNLDSPHFVDVFRFRQLLNDASKVDQAQSNEQVLGLLQEAVGLYQGDLYENEYDAEYFEAEREYLRQLYVSAVKRLVEIRISRGELEQACTCLREALRIYAVEEDLHQRLIKLLLTQGKRREAFKQFHLCVEILRADLDAEPLPETLHLESLLAPSS